MNWRGIIIHHSATDDDGFKSDWDGIRRYHTSWRLRDQIMTPDEVEAYKAAVRGLGTGDIPTDWPWHGILSPWRDIGYHVGIEMVGGRLEVQPGRPLSVPGAHCFGKNQTHLGVCFVGDFDQEHPSDAHYYEGAILILHLMRQYPAITLDTIEPHSRYADKTCPGQLFSMDRLKTFVSKA